LELFQVYAEVVKDLKNQLLQLKIKLDDRDENYLALTQISKKY
jgi:hypothetical protein